MKKIIYTIFFLCGTLVFSQEKKNDTADVAATKEIQEVILKSQRKKQFADKAVYTFDKEALEKALRDKKCYTHFNSEMLYKTL